MNEIKLDKLGISLAPAKLVQPADKKSAEHVKTEGVSVTNNTNRLVNLLGGEDVSPEENARVLAAKSLVDSGQYQVDVHVLSEKLLNSGVLSRGE